MLNCTIHSELWKKRHVARVKVNSYNSRLLHLLLIENDEDFQFFTLNLDEWGMECACHAYLFCLIWWLISSWKVMTNQWKKN